MRRLGLNSSWKTVDTMLLRLGALTRSRLSLEAEAEAEAEVEAQHRRHRQPVVGFKRPLTTSLLCRVETRAAINRRRRLHGARRRRRLHGARRRRRHGARRRLLLVRWRGVAGRAGLYPRGVAHRRHLVLHLRLAHRLALRRRLAAPE